MIAEGCCGSCGDSGMLEEMSSSNESEGKNTTRSKVAPSLEVLAFEAGFYLELAEKVSSIEAAAADKLNANSEDCPVSRALALKVQQRAGSLDLHSQPQVRLFRELPGAKSVGGLTAVFSSKMARAETWAATLLTTSSWEGGGYFLIGRDIAQALEAKYSGSTGTKHLQELSAEDIIHVVGLMKKAPAPFRIAAKNFANTLIESTYQDVKSQAKAVALSIRSEVAGKELVCMERMRDWLDTPQAERGELAPCMIDSPPTQAIKTESMDTESKRESDVIGSVKREIELDNANLSEEISCSNRGMFYAGYYLTIACILEEEWGGRNAVNILYSTLFQCQTLDTKALQVLDFIPNQEARIDSQFCDKAMRTNVEAHTLLERHSWEGGCYFIMGVGVAESLNERLGDRNRPVVPARVSPSISKKRSNVPIPNFMKVNEELLKHLSEVNEMLNPATRLKCVDSVQSRIDPLVHKSSIELSTA